MKKNIAVVLSGCGYLDGSEITEAVSVYISLSQVGAKYHSFAPKSNAPSMNHYNQKSDSTMRNSLEEAARITRGQILPLEELNESLYDGLILPGGYGVAKNLSDLAQNETQCQVNSILKKQIQLFHQNSKPILAICIAPAIVAHVLGPHHIAVTIGDDLALTEIIQKTGAQHVNCDVTDYITDRENKIISTPAYMYAAQPHEVFMGIQKAFSEFYEMA